MLLIVGLGNPGERYAPTRHNVGSRVVERAAARWGWLLVPKGPALVGSGCLGSSEVTAAVPLAFMNQTGPVVKALVDTAGIPPDHLLVVHDDLDLEPGRLRIKREGGPGGHNGVRSVIASLGTDQFSRLKLGIGHPAPGLDPADYVLDPFPASERPVIAETMERAVDALECVVREGLEAAMNRFNIRPKPDVEDRDA